MARFQGNAWLFPPVLQAADPPFSGQRPRDENAIHTRETRSPGKLP